MRGGRGGGGGRSGRRWGSWDLLFSLQSQLRLRTALQFYSAKPPHHPLLTALPNTFLTTVTGIPDTFQTQTLYVHFATQHMNLCSLPRGRFPESATSRLTLRRGRGHWAETTPEYRRQPAARLRAARPNTEQAYRAAAQEAPFHALAQRS